MSRPWVKIYGTNEAPIEPLMENIEAMASHFGITGGRGLPDDQTPNRSGMIRLLMGLPPEAWEILRPWIGGNGN